MNRLLVFFLIALNAPSSAQVLFTYGTHSVSRSEFLTAYSKNTGDTNSPKLSYSDYLELYAKFKMKVQAALDEKMDTTAQQHSEVRAFRYQLAEGYLKENASINVLVEEAKERSLKDIHLTSIYVPFKPGPTPAELDAAQKKIGEAYLKLKNGETFEKVAGEIAYADFNFITTFLLPYEIENIAYTTPVGRFSAPYQGSKAFHIFRPVEERKAIGKIRVAQILLAFPPNADGQAKKIISQRADSAYNALRSGADFAKLASLISNDNLSYETGGQLPVFGIGEYDPVFEKEAFALAKDGDFSRPFETSFGYHIVLRIERLPAVAAANNKEWDALIRDRVEQSDRMQVARQKLLENIRRTIKKDAPGETQTSDTAALQYYRDHLENYNADFAAQLKEFGEGNLLFTIMQKKVWDAATNDTAALLRFFNDNKNKYWWENSADALLITSVNKKRVEEMRGATKTKFSNWRKWMDDSNGAMQIDSGRYELGQIPVIDRTNFTEGLVTGAVSGTLDSSATFAYIIKLHTGREPKKLEDAKGAVINDYQVYLENKWIAELKQKYPLKINQKVFNGLR